MLQHFIQRRLLDKPQILRFDRLMILLIRMLSNTVQCVWHIDWVKQFSNEVWS